MTIVRQYLHLFNAIWTHPANLNRRSRSLWRALYWQISKRLKSRPTDIDIQGLRLRCHPDSHSASRALYFSGMPDYWEMRFMLDYLRPGDRFIDVGANVGLYTLLAASIVSPSGHIDAFEPGTTASARFQENMEINQLTNVTLHRLALSDVAGFMRFNRTEDDCCAHISPIGQDGSECSLVRTVRLDTHLPTEFYAMAKLDIEGYEPFVVRGAAHLMDQGRLPVLLLEMAGYSKRFGISTSDFIAEINRLGYECAVYDPDARVLIPTDRPWAISVDNLLAIKKDQLAFVSSRLSATTK